MARVTIAAGATGSDIVLAATTIFAVESGSVELSTDAGTTFIEFFSNEKVVFSSGLTVTPKNTRGDTAILKYMAM